MKTLLSLTLLLACLFFSKARAQQTPLKLSTFNSLTVANTTIGNITGVDSLFGMGQDFFNASARSAIAPERNWYTFIGKSDTASFKLYTVDLNTAGVVYSAPANFVNARGLTSAFTDFHYSDTLGKLVGIYTDSTGSKLASCNLQTGVISPIAPVKSGNRPITAYSHTHELFYYIGSANDTFLYAVDPVTGHRDSLDLTLNTLFLGSGSNYNPIYHLQFDDLNDRLLAIVKRQVSGPDGLAVISINRTTGQLSRLNSILADPLRVSNLYYPWCFDATNGRYLFQFLDLSQTTTYFMSANTNGSAGTLYDSDTIFVPNQVLTNFEYNYLTGQVYALNVNFDSVRTAAVPVQTICKVTADSASTHNIVVWEKANKAATDSFHIYREVSANQYAIIGAVDGDSLSEYHDYGANPNTSSYRYKISVRDTAGLEGYVSEYHNSLHVQFTGAGNISWTTYTIGSSSPITTYNVYCDSLANGNWYLMGNVPGTQTAFTDIAHGNHTSALYRVEANFPYSCTASRSASSIISNITFDQLANISDAEDGARISLFPNPASNAVRVIVSEQMKGATITITNTTGQKLAMAQVQNLNTTLATDFANGIYFVTVANNGRSYTKKLVVNH